MPNWTRPYYTVRIEAIACRYDLMVNGFPVDSFDQRGNVVVEVPVNPFVLTGRNELRAVLRPGPASGARFADDAQFEATLCGREDDAPVTQREPIAGFMFSGEQFAVGTGLESTPDFDAPDGPRATRVDDATVRVDRSIALETPFPRWAWMDAPLLDDSPATRDSLLAEYRRFHTQLAAGDRAGVEGLASVRIRETALAYYVSETQATELVGVGENIGDPAMTLRGLRDDLRLEIIANRHCARLVTPTGKNAIVYESVSEPGMGMFLALSYCRDTSGNWLQIR